MPPKSLENSPIFKSRTRSVPDSVLQQLTVRSDGTELTWKLEEWGAPDLNVNPVITILITTKESTARITDSRFVIRGPVFEANASRPLKANKIWAEVEPDITVRFTVPGSAVNMNNMDARNASLWEDLMELTDIRFFKAGTPMTLAEVDDIPALREGASYRVAVFPHSVTHMEAVLLVAPVSLTTIRSKAKAWKISPESLDFPAINLTSHCTVTG